MGMTRSLSKIPAIVAALIFLFCVCLSTWNILSLYKPKVDKVVDQTIGQYDTVLPEIMIKKGKASIKEEQPFFLNDDTKKGPIIVIDTRPGAQKELMARAIDSKKFVALTQDFLIVKDERQYRTLPLKGIPDVTVNAELIEKLKNQFYPATVAAVTIIIGIYYLFAKLIQILILALPFYWLTQRTAVPLTYGQSFKITTFALIIPVIVDMYLSRLTIGTAVSWSAYLVVYLAVLGIAYWDYTNAPPGQLDRQAPINP
jgi:hypothetical protein